MSKIDPKHATTYNRDEVEVTPLGPPSTEHHYMKTEYTNNNNSKVMTPKEKAKELVDSFVRMYGGIISPDLYVYWCKQSAIKVVNEIILSRKDDSQFDDTLWAGGSDMYSMHPMYLKYWQEVNQEIGRYKLR